MPSLKDLLPGLSSAKTGGARENAEELPLAVPAYYEVWGGLESANRALWIAVWFAATVALLALIMLRVQLGRPPVVIRVDDAGQAQLVADPSRQPPVSEAEVKNFLTLFERFFTALNVHTYEADLTNAFAMMTPTFQSQAGDLIKREAVIEKLKAADRRTTLTLTEIRVVSDTPQVFECQVKGYRELSSYKTDVPAQEIVFEDDVILKKVPRSEAAPNGVLVEAWVESLFKK